MSKTYSTGEIIDILKPGQRAKVVAENWSSGTLICDENSQIRWEHGMECIYLREGLRNAKWQLLPQYVTFEEALKAYKEGKQVRCESEHGNWFVYTPSNPQYEVSFQRMINGKWSIVDGDE